MSEKNMSCSVLEHPSEEDSNIVIHLDPNVLKYFTKLPVTPFHMHFFTEENILSFFFSKL